MVRLHYDAVRLSSLKVTVDLQRPNFANLFFCAPDICGNNCITCHYITDGRTNYTFSATGETRTIPDHIDCNSKNLIYMVHCLRCNKQYIGETKRRLKDRFNEHRRPVDRPSFRTFSFRRSYTKRHGTYPTRTHTFIS